MDAPAGKRGLDLLRDPAWNRGTAFTLVALRLRAITDGMIDAALEALVQMIPASRDPRASLMPALSEAAAVGAAVADAVGRAGVREGLAPEGVAEEAVPALLERARWRPRYPALPLAAPPDG